MLYAEDLAMLAGAQSPRDDRNQASSLEERYDL